MYLHTSIIHVDWVKDKKFVNDSYDRTTLWKCRTKVWCYIVENWTFSVLIKIVSNMDEGSVVSATRFFVSLSSKHAYTMYRYSYQSALYTFDT